MHFKEPPSPRFANRRVDCAIDGRMFRWQSGNTSLCVSLQEVTSVRIFSLAQVPLFLHARRGPAQREGCLLRTISGSTLALPRVECPGPIAQELCAKIADFNPTAVFTFGPRWWWPGVVVLSLLSVMCVAGVIAITQRPSLADVLFVGLLLAVVSYSWIRALPARPRRIDPHTFAIRFWREKPSTS